MMEHGGHGPHGIGEGVFGYAFTMVEEDQLLTHWLMWFYESIFISVFTGPQAYIDQFDKPKNEPRYIGIW